MTLKRESNYDLLRIFAAIAVISIHVSSLWLTAITDSGMFGVIYSDRIFVTCLYNVLPRFAVPCFLMLSGAFILADKRNMQYKYFYQKIILSVGIPTVIFSSVYFVASFGKALVKVLIGGNELFYLLHPFFNWVRGEPFFHMWYLYMMIEVYLLVPVVLLFKEQVGESTFSKVAWVFLAAASIGGWTSTSDLNWDIGSSFRYLSFLMIGYVLRNKYFGRKNLKKASCIIQT